MIEKHIKNLFAICLNENTLWVHSTSVNIKITSDKFIMGISTYTVLHLLCIYLFQKGQ